MQNYNPNIKQIEIELQLMRRKSSTLLKMVEPQEKITDYCKFLFGVSQCGRQEIM
jgi:hypothetical protein